MEDLLQFDWYTTPEDLRALAIKIQQFWESAMPGQENIVAVINCRGVDLRIRVDQEKMTGGRMVTDD